MREESTYVSSICSLPLGALPSASVNSTVFVCQFLSCIVRVKSFSAVDGGAWPMWRLFHKFVHMVDLQGCNLQIKMETM